MSVILVDTSVWVEFLRGTSSRATAWLVEHLGVDSATCEPVLMELVAGSRPGAATRRVEALLLGQAWCHVEPALDFRGAADVFHASRAAGHQPRSLQDCLVAAVALRCGVAVAHRGADYAYISAATGLAHHDLRDPP